MTSTNDEKEVKIKQTSGPKGKAYFIELFKSLDSRLNEAAPPSERTQQVCDAWRKIHNICLHSTASAHDHLLSWLQRHTARVVLQTSWQKPERKDDRASLEEAINVLIVETRTAAASRNGPCPDWEVNLVERGEWFKRILDQPWQNPVLTCLLNASGTPPSDDEVVEWLKEERGVTFVARLQTLAAEKQCDDIAVTLATAVMDRVRRDEPSDCQDKDKPQTTGPTFRHRLKVEAGFTVDVWELLVDIEFVLLHKRDSARCIALAKQTPLRSAHYLIERLQGRVDTSPRDKRLWKSSKEVAVLIAQVVITRCMVCVTCLGETRSALYRASHALARLTAAARLPAAAAALAAPAPTAEHLHTLAAGIDLYLSQKNEVSMKPFLCELYVRAITAGMNELERLKLKTEKEPEARCMEQALASWFVQLGAVLGSSRRFKCECALTAFSLHPSPQMYEKIKAAPALPPINMETVEETSSEATNPEFGSWASDSRSQTNFVKTSETLKMKARQNQANVLSTALLNECEGLGLSPELCQDITVLLSGPRVKTLSWDMDRELLLENCRGYLERTQGGTKAVTTELKYLNLNPNDFQYLPEEDDEENNLYYGIEKGYEHLVEPEPENIWEDYGNFENADKTYSSDEFEFTTPQRKKKTKKPVLNSEEDDPLSQVAEEKRKEKKERPHSKERSKERKRDKSVKKPLVDPLDLNESSEIKEKPKKERKKKEKTPAPESSLSNLVGLKVAKPRKKKNVIGSGASHISQQKSPIRSMNSEDNIIYDGQYSMDEMRSPLSTHSSDSMAVMQNLYSMDNLQGGVSGTHQSLYNRPQRPPSISQRTASPFNPQSPLEHSRNNSPTQISDDVRSSISRLIEFRRQKALENERKKPNAIIRPEGMAIDKNISPKSVLIPEIPKSYINKQQSDKLKELRKEVDEILKHRQKSSSIPSPVIQYASKNSTSSPSSQPDYVSPPKFNMDREAMARSGTPAPGGFMDSVNYVSIYDKNEPSHSRNPFPGLANPSTNEPVNIQNYLHEFHKQSTYNHFAEKKAPSKVSRPSSRVTPVVPKPKAERKTSQSAKQTPQKPEGSLNTFSRLNYYKNKQTDMRRSQDLTIGAKLDGFIMEHLLNTQQVEKQRSQSNDAPVTNKKQETLRTYTKVRDPATSSIVDSSTPAQTYQSATPAKASIHQSDQRDFLQFLQQQNALPGPSTSSSPSNNRKHISHSNVSKPTNPQIGLHTSNHQMIKPNEPRKEGRINIISSSIVKAADPSNVLSSQHGSTKKPSHDQSRKHEIKALKPTKPETTVRKDPQEWENVLNALLKQKTPYRGPNALDVALNKSSFEKAFVESLKEPSSLFQSNGQSPTEEVSRIEYKHEELVKITKTKTVSSTANEETISITERKTHAVLTTEITRQKKNSKTKNHNNANKKLPVSTVKKVLQKQNIEPHTIEKLIRHNNIQIYKSNPIPEIEVQGKAFNQCNIIKPNQDVHAKMSQMRKTQTKKDVKQTNITTKHDMRQIVGESRNKEAKTEVQKHNNDDVQRQFNNTRPKHGEAFIPGIPSSDYDLLDELMDDDLRKEIGELSSDEDSYNVAAQNFLNDDNTNKKHVSVVYNHPLNNVVVKAAPQDSHPPICKPNEVIQSYTQKPVQQWLNNKDVKTLTTEQNKPAISYGVASVQNVTTHIVTQPIQVAAYNANINQITIQPNVYIARQSAPVQNVMVFPPTLVYENYAAVQTPIETVPNVTPYITNIVPSVNLYQTNRYVANVASPIIISSAVTHALNNVQGVSTVPKMATVVTAVNASAYSYSSSELHQPTYVTAQENVVAAEKIQQSVYEPGAAGKSQQPMYESTVKENDIVAEAKKFDFKVAASSSVPIADNIENNSQHNLENRTFVEANVNKSCERKVLIEVQENQTDEKNECKRRNQVSIEKDLKTEADKERLIKKRMAILNRKVSHFCGVQTIALGYSPLQITTPRRMQEFGKDNKATDKELATSINNVQELNKDIGSPATPDSFKENKIKTLHVPSIILRSSNKLKNKNLPTTSSKLPFDKKLRLAPVVSINKLSLNDLPIQKGQSDADLNSNQKRVSKRIRNKFVVTPKGKSILKPKATCKLDCCKQEKTIMTAIKKWQKDKDNKTPKVQDSPVSHDAEFLDIEAELLGDTIPKALPVNFLIPEYSQNSSFETKVEEENQTSDKVESSLLLTENRLVSEESPVAETPSVGTKAVDVLATNASGTEVEPTAKVTNVTANATEMGFGDRFVEFARTISICATVEDPAATAKAVDFRDASDLSVTVESTAVQEVNAAKTIIKTKEEESSFVPGEAMSMSSNVVETTDLRVTVGGSPAKEVNVADAITACVEEMTPAATAEAIDVDETTDLRVTVGGSPAKEVNVADAITACVEEMSPAATAEAIDVDETTDLSVTVEGSAVKNVNVAETISSYVEEVRPAATVEAIDVDETIGLSATVEGSAIKELYVAETISACVEEVRPAATVEAIDVDETIGLSATVEGSAIEEVNVAENFSACVAENISACVEEVRPTATAEAIDVSEKTDVIVNVEYSPAKKVNSTKEISICYEEVEPVATTKTCEAETNSDSMTEVEVAAKTDVAATATTHMPQVGLVNILTTDTRLTNDTATDAAITKDNVEKDYPDNVVIPDLFCNELIPVDIVHTSDTLKTSNITKDVKAQIASTDNKKIKTVAKNTSLINSNNNVMSKNKDLTDDDDDVEIIENPQFAPQTNKPDMELSKDNIKIFEIFDPDNRDPLKKKVRIKLANGKTFKGTISGSVSFESLLDSPEIKAMLLSQFQTPKKLYSLKLNVNKVSSNSTKIVPQVQYKKDGPVETVSLLSDDEDEVCSQVFVTEYGKYKINTIDRDIFTKHQNKFKLKCNVLAQKLSDKANHTPSRESESKAMNSAILIEDNIQNCVLKDKKETKLKDTNLLSNIPSKYVKNIINDIANMGRDPLQAKPEEPIVLIDDDDSSNGSVDKNPEPAEKIDLLKNMLLKDLGVPPMSPTNKSSEDVQVTWASEAIDLSDDSVMELSDSPSDEEKSNNYKDITNNKCFVKLVRCDHMMAQPAFNLKEDTKLKDNEVRPGKVSRSASWSILDDFPVTDGDLIESDRSSPVMEAYDLIAYHKATFAKGITKLPTQSISCKSEWMITKNKSKKRKLSKDCITNCISSKTKYSENVLNIPAQLNCDAEWMITKKINNLITDCGLPKKSFSVPKLTTLVLKLIQLGDFVNKYYGETRHLSHNSLKRKSIPSTFPVAKISKLNNTLEEALTPDVTDVTILSVPVSFHNDNSILTENETKLEKSLVVEECCPKQNATKCNDVSGNIATSADYNNMETTDDLNDDILIDCSNIVICMEQTDEVSRDIVSGNVVSTEQKVINELGLKPKENENKTIEESVFSVIKDKLTNRENVHESFDIKDCCISSINEPVKQFESKFKQSNEKKEIKPDAANSKNNDDVYDALEKIFEEPENQPKQELKHILDNVSKSLKSDKCTHKSQEENIMRNVRPPQTTDEIYEVLNKMFGESKRPDSKDISKTDNTSHVHSTESVKGNATDNVYDKTNATLRESYSQTVDSGDEILEEDVDSVDSDIIDDLIDSEHDLKQNKHSGFGEELAPSFILESEDKIVSRTSGATLLNDLECSIKDVFKDIDYEGSDTSDTRYVYAIIEDETECNEEDNFEEILLNVHDENEMEFIKVIMPKRTYSNSATKNNARSRGLKRKKDMTDFKTSGKKYRKGKNIDYPKISAQAIAGLVYAKEYKQIIDYSSTIKFSYSRPFHIDYIDVENIQKAWPILATHKEVNESNNAKDILYTDPEDVESAITDPLKRTLNEEIVNGNNVPKYKSIVINEINFNMGFGEKSGRVIQKIESGNTKLSAATLSDVKQYQPFPMSEIKNVKSNLIKEREVQAKLNFMDLISMKQKVRSFFEKTAFQLSTELLQDKKYATNDLSTYLFDLTGTEFMEVPRKESIVNIVQVGQMTINAAAQNPVTCDPRVTHVSDASPSQCSDNSPGEGSHSNMETEYTELTTANIALPIQAFSQNNQPTQKAQNSEDDVNGTSIVKIELMEEETSQEKLETDIYSNDFSPLPNNNVEYSFEDTSNILFNSSANAGNTCNNTTDNASSNLFNTSSNMDSSFTNIFTSSTNMEGSYTNLETSSSIDSSYASMENASTTVYNTSSNLNNSSSEMENTSNLSDTSSNIISDTSIDTRNIDNPYPNMYPMEREPKDISNVDNNPGNRDDSHLQPENGTNDEITPKYEEENSAYNYSYESIQNYENMENNNNGNNFSTNVGNYSSNGIHENFPSNVDGFDSNNDNYATNNGSYSSGVENYSSQVGNYPTNIDNYPNVQSYDKNNSNTQINLTNIGHPTASMIEDSQPQDLSMGNSTQGSKTYKDKGQENGTSKTDQLAHAMSAAGISSESVIATTPDELVSLISQGTQSNANNYTKQAPSNQQINVMTLQQALAQVLPPPLNQASPSENQVPNNPVPQQVLHIVQGSNAQTVINKPNGTHLLHIVQNKSNPNTNGLSLVDAGLQQGGNQLIHIVNNGNHNNAQFLKRVNLLTNLQNAQGSNEQKMIQLVCKSADGKSIQLNTGPQRSMVLRLHPSSVQTAQKPEPQDLSATSGAPNTANNQDTSQEIKSRSMYEENYAQFIQNSAPIPGPSTSPCQEKTTSLPKFNQVFGKQSYQDNPEINHNGLQENSECPPDENRHVEQPSEPNPPSIARNAPPETTQTQSNPVQQIKQAISPMNIQTMHGGVIYTRQIPVNIGGGQTINLITVPSTEMVDDSTPKQAEGSYVNQEEPSSIIKLVPHHPQNNQNVTPSESNAQAGPTNEPQNPSPPQPQPMLTQMRIKLPMLSKGPHIVPGTRLVRPSFFQIQRNVIAGTNQPVYQQLVLTTAPSLGQTIRVPAQQTSSAQSPQTQPILVQTAQHSQPSPHIPVQQVQHAPTSHHTHSSQQAHSAPPTPQPPSVQSESKDEPESELSTLTLEQLREFDMVLEQVKERRVQPTPSTTPNTLSKAASADSTDGPALTTTAVSESTQQVMYSTDNNQPVVSYVNRKSTITTASTSFARSPDSSGIMDTPSSSTHVHVTATVSSKSSDGGSTPVAQPKKKKKKKSSSSNAMASLGSPSKNSSLKPQEDEQTTQRILYILAEYKEQVENSPDKNKPAPRRRNQFPPTTGSKRKRSHCSSRSACKREGVEMSPMHEHGENGEDSLITLGSEDSSCGTTFSECTDCQESHSPEDSPTKVVRRLTFEHETTTQTITQTRTTAALPQRNVIVGQTDGQTVTVARTTTTATATPAKPTTTVLMPANYLLPVSMIKGGQQIAIMTNRGPKILVGAGDNNAGALLFQRLIGPGLKPVLTRPGIRHIRLPATALHNLQAFNIQTTPVTHVQPPDSTAPQAATPAPPDLVDTRAMSSPWPDREAQDKPERGPSPDCTEPWNIPSSSIADDYGYEEIVRTDNMERTVLDAIPDRYSPDMEAQRIFDKMFDVDTKKSMYSPRCGYDIDTSDGDDRPFQQVVQRKDGRHHRLSHVSTAALRHKYAILEHELRLQKSLSEECEDLGVDSPSASDLFPEADILFGAPSPAHEQTIDQCNTPPPIPMPPIAQELEDKSANDRVLHPSRDELDLIDDVGEIVTVGEDGVATIPTINAEEFARSHPNTTFHTEPEEGEITIAQPPFTLAHGLKRHITFHGARVPGTVLIAPQTSVISQAVHHGNTVKFADIDNIINAVPAPQVTVPSVVVKDHQPSRQKYDIKEPGTSRHASKFDIQKDPPPKPLSKFDSLLNESKLRLNQASQGRQVVTGHGAQVIRRLDSGRRHEERERPNHRSNSRFHFEEPRPRSHIADEVKMRNDRAMVESMGDNASSPGQPELLWESGRHEKRYHYNESDKVAKSPFDELLNDSSAYGPHTRLDSVIKAARPERTYERTSFEGIGVSGSEDNRPLRTYPPKRPHTQHTQDSERHFTLKTTPTHHHEDRTKATHHHHDVGKKMPRCHESEGMRRTGRGLVKRSCSCCSIGPSAPPKKRSRPKKPKSQEFSPTPAPNT